MTSHHPPPQHSNNHTLEIVRLPTHTAAYYEIKDPSIVKKKNGDYLMFASIGNSEFQQWQIGRFIASQVQGPWQELSPVTFTNLSGPQVCAPAVRYEDTTEGELWTMYVQSCCFETDGYIALATSQDGQHFTAAEQPLLTREMLGQHREDVIGLYDAGISQVTVNNQPMHCLVFSGYRRVGCGDVYMTYAPIDTEIPSWAPPQRILSQEEVPFHNHPDYEWFEWGLEGAQIIQLIDQSYLMFGVCFLPKPDGHLGTRQRVFMAHAKSLLGPFVPLTTPLDPQPQEKGTGENGHPDAVMNGNTLNLIYQERSGQGQPWYLRHAQFDLQYLTSYTQTVYQQRVNEKNDTPPLATTPNYPPEATHLLL